ncbi:MAG: superoxide dismutase [Ni] [Victivallaceae bacterium]|nr:superoxide dismutase [Ni] [Victivallaceae bacterium]
MRMKSVIFTVIAAAACMAWFVYAHCEIPCGIYDDPMRMKMIYEHITTLDKSVHEINHLNEAEKPNYNQLVRWIENKDEHADQLQEIVSQYFMTQRIKPAEPGEPGYDKYVRQITLLHRMLIQAMKVKQSTDPAEVDKLKAIAAEFDASYFGK